MLGCRWQIAVLPRDATIARKLCNSITESGDCFGERIDLAPKPFHQLDTEWRLNDVKLRTRG